jgi:hypothetical protein
MQQGSRTTPAVGSRKEGRGQVRKDSDQCQCRAGAAGGAEGKWWNRQTWLSHEQTLRRGAFKAAFHAVKFGIPLKLLSASDLSHGRSGFVTHATVSEVFHGDHTDPGDGFPLDHYMELVKQFAQDIQT